jgi:hypothetical protein
MSQPPASLPDRTTDACAELRAAVARDCDQARQAIAARDATIEHIRDLKRDLTAAQHKRAEAEAAAAPELRSADKERARERYEQARQLASDDAALAEATATWAQAIDRINRAGRLADRAVSAARRSVQQLEEALRQAERDEQTARLRADQAEAACLDARVRLATCEEQVRAEPRPATAFEPHAATGGHAVAIGRSERVEPLAIESMVSGDRLALELAATRIAELSGLPEAQSQLRLQELVDAILDAAASDGFLDFDPDHRFWATLTFEEARDVVGALERLGFRFEAAEGWHAGRAPAPMDLSMALAYAGLDARNMRDLPTAEELRELPRSIRVDARGFLATHAPTLSVDSIVQALGRRAAALEPLWNQWGQVRPVLLSPRRALGTSTG